MKRLFALATILISLTASVNAHPHHYDESVYYAPPARVYYPPTPYYPPAYNCVPQRVPYYGYGGYVQPYFGPEIRFGFGGGRSRVNVILR